MNIARLSIGYDRGVTRNDEETVAQHLGLFDASEAKASAVKKAEKAKRVQVEAGPDQDGIVVRGLGTHFRSAADAELVKLRDADAKKLYTSWRETFISTPLDGVYVIPHAGAAKEWLRGQQFRDDMKVRVSEFELVTTAEMEGEEIQEWVKRIKGQLSSVSLGRGKAGDEKGLSALAALSTCPILSKATATRIKELVAMARNGQVDRVELKRRIDTTQIEIEQAPLNVRRRIDISEKEAVG